MSNFYPYDIECLPNVFTLHIRSYRTGKKRTYEISRRKNEVGPIRAFFDRMGGTGARMVGYNNIDYDYPVVHYLLVDLATETDWRSITRKLYKKSQSIIKADYFHRFDHRVAPYKHLVPQIDLRLIHHFDNKNRMVSLKELEFNMLMDNIQEFDCSFTEDLPDHRIPGLIDYNDHDGDATEKFMVISLPDIEFREIMGAKYDRNMINYNNGKIGNEIFISQLERRLGKNICFTKVPGKSRKPKQTKRESIDLGEVMFDNVQMETPQFSAVKDWLAKQIIKETKGVFSDLELEQMLDFLPYSHLIEKKGVREYVESGGIDKTPRSKKAERNLNVRLDGVDFFFGVGGIHGSVVKKHFSADEEWCIVDVDVTSYYPSIGIENGIYPEHLGPEFCDIYRDIKAQRVAYAKGTAENKALKESLNIPYGNSNSKFSPFYDPKYTMSVTVNGQLQLCMLYESLREINDLQLIQINTDGLTVRLRRTDLDQLREKCDAWEKITKLNLEYADYDMMHVRDVNNYLALYSETGKVKRKGAYAYVRPQEPDAELGWHQNHSALVVPKAASHHLLTGGDIETFIREHDYKYDFMLRAKVPRSSKLMADYGLGLEIQTQNLTRYYIAQQGATLTKIMPPTERKPGVWRPMAISKGNQVGICNRIEDFNWGNLKYDWYIEEAKKLVYFE